MKDISIARVLGAIAGAAGMVVFAAIAVLAAVMLPAARSIPPVAVVAVFLPAPFVYGALLLGWIRRRRPAITYLGLSATFTVMILAGVAWVGSERAIHPSPCDEVPALAEYPALERLAEEVNFPSHDGTRLAGWYIPGEKAATIMLIHGYGCRRQEMLRHADVLHEVGFGVLLFDLRGRGESEGESVTLGYYERGDALGAVDYLRGRADSGGDQIGVLGVSLGGATAILAAAESAAIRAVVAESTFRSVDSVVSQSFTRFINLPAFPFAPLTIWLSEQRLGIDSASVAPEREVTKIAPRPLLVIHGLEDETISPGDGQAVFAAAGEPKQWWLIPGAGHADGIKVAPDEYGHRIVEFFDTHLQ